MPQWKGDCKIWGFHGSEIGDCFILEHRTISSFEQILLPSSLFCTKNGIRRFLYKRGIFLPHYKVSHPIRKQYSEGNSVSEVDTICLALKRLLALTTSHPSLICSRRKSFAIWTTRRQKQFLLWTPSKWHSIPKISQLLHHYLVLIFPLVYIQINKMYSLVKEV